MSQFHQNVQGAPRHATDAEPQQRRPTNVPTHVPPGLVRPFPYNVGAKTSENAYSFIAAIPEFRISQGETVETWLGGMIGGARGGGTRTEGPGACATYFLR